MHEIICPHCSKAFKIDEAGYADILKQVRDGEFEQALHERLELAEREKRDAIALAKAEVTNALQKAAAAKDTEIQALKAQLDAGEVARKLAVAEALGAVAKSAMRWRMSWHKRAAQQAAPSWPRPSWRKSCRAWPPKRTPRFRRCKPSWRPARWRASWP
jgi:hypothetical protein